MRLRVNQEIDLPITKRYVQHNRSQSIGDVYDALVELITNADDSYGRLYKKGKRAQDGGDILIRCEERRKGLPSRVVVCDKAEGMDEETIAAKLLPIGANSAESGSRGHMGRGAKDCAELGCVVFESIKDGRYYRVRITGHSTAVPEVLGGIPTQGDRRRMGLPHGNGTSVTLELEGGGLPRFLSLAADLPWHYALRDIMSQDYPGTVRLLHSGQTEREARRLVCYPPDGSELVLDETYEIHGYQGAQARMRVWRTPEPLEDRKSRFEKFGILIKGRRAIHEWTLLADEFKKDEAARRFFGRIDCQHLGNLMDEYEKLRSTGQRDPLNPHLVVDPSRRFGLDQRHPFVQALLQTACERFRTLVAKEKEQHRSQETEIANDETRTRLNRLARVAERFLREELDETDGISDGEWVEPDGLAKRGAVVVPSGASISVGEEKRFYVYANSELLNGSDTFTVQCDSDALEIVDGPFSLSLDERRSDRVRGIFRVRGRRVTPATGLKVLCGALDPLEAYLEVVEDKPAEYQFANPLEFEHDEYRVRAGGTRDLHLLAKYPDLVADRTELQVRSLSPAKLAIRGKCFLVPVTGTDYAEGWVTVEGRTVNSQVDVTATLNGSSAQTSVRVVDKPREPGVQMEIKLVPKSLGPFRAVWSLEPGKSHVLEVSGLHPSLKRYLGEPIGDPPEFRGQDSPIYRALLAEIVGEAVCHRLLLEEAARQSYELDDLRTAQELKDKVDTVRTHQHRKLSKFLILAHAAMVKDTEAKSE